MSPHPGLASTEKSGLFPEAGSVPPGARSSILAAHGGLAATLMPPPTPTFASLELKDKMAFPRLSWNRSRHPHLHWCPERGCGEGVRAALPRLPCCTKWLSIFRWLGLESWGRLVPSAPVTPHPSVPAHPAPDDFPDFHDTTSCRHGHRSGPCFCPCPQQAVKPAPQP